MYTTGKVLYIVHTIPVISISLCTGGWIGSGRKTSEHRGLSTPVNSTLTCESAVALCPCTSIVNLGGYAR